MFVHIARRPCAIAAVACFGLASLFTGNAAISNPPRSEFGTLVHETKSQYSHIRVRQRNSIFTLLFVRDNGDEIGETQIDMRKPHNLKIPYTQTMFANFFFDPHPKKVLIVGLGGGAMVHFLAHHCKDVYVDAVEIDAEVVAAADKYFNCRSSDQAKIHTADGLKFIANSEDKYDVIYMDAFLKISNETDAAGVPRNLKTEAFYKQAQTKLTDKGIMVFNLNVHSKTRDDVQLLKRVFSKAMLFKADDSNYVFVGLPNDDVLDRNTLRARAKELDQRFDASFSFFKMTTTVVPMSR
ncbi:MAG: spermidine synthase [Pirellulaceae bacterium]|jgi:spermidine synthase